MCALQIHMHHIISSSYCNIWTELRRSYLRIQKKDAIYNYVIHITIVQHLSNNQVLKHV